jgi:uncharacterized protein (TIGR02391 family)
MKLDDVYAAADKLRRSVAVVQKEAKAVKTTCLDINTSWSQSALTRHAKFYFGNYEEPPATSRFNIEWGLIHGIPDGWEEKSNEEVCQEIEKRSGVSLDDFKEKVTKIEDEFEALKRGASLTLIEQGIADVSEIEGFKFENATDYFNTLNPTTYMTRDSAAITSGRYIAPHIYFEAVAMSALGIEGQLDEFIYKIKKLGVGTDAPQKSYDFWSTIHPAIRSVSEKQFKNGHYLDAVRSAFIEFNDKVKQKYKKDAGTEEDGFNLMKLAFGDFSASNSTFNGTVKYSLADLSTDSGKNFQKGFSLMSAGTVLGLRNPRAHANVIDEKDEAIHLIFLASWLMKTAFP